MVTDTDPSDREIGLPRASARSPRPDSEGSSRGRSWAPIINHYVANARAIRRLPGRPDLASFSHKDRARGAGRYSSVVLHPRGLRSKSLTSCSTALKLCRERHGMSSPARGLGPRRMTAHVVSRARCRRVSKIAKAKAPTPKFYLLRLLCRAPRPIAPSKVSAHESGLSISSRGARRSKDERAAKRRHADPTRRSPNLNAGFRSPGARCRSSICLRRSMEPS